MPPILSPPRPPVWPLSRSTTWPCLATSLSTCASRAVVILRRFGPGAAERRSASRWVPCVARALAFFRPRLRAFRSHYTPFAASRTPRPHSCGHHHLVSFLPLLNVQHLPQVFLWGVQRKPRVDDHTGRLLPVRRVVQRDEGVCQLSTSLAHDGD